MLHNAGPKGRQAPSRYIDKLYKDMRFLAPESRLNKYQSRKPTRTTHLEPYHYLAVYLKLWKVCYLTDHLQLQDMNSVKYWFFFCFFGHKGHHRWPGHIGLSYHREISTKSSKECIAVYVDLEKAFELAQPLVVTHDASKLGIKGHMLAYIVYT